jgi:diaminopimelate decarboxylase
MSTYFPTQLLPKTARATLRGLEIGGVSVADLVEKYGSPLLVYDEEHIRDRCRNVLSAFPDGASYAAKAFLCRSIARLMASEKLGIDVASGGELAIALSAGLSPADMTLHGNNKSRSEIEAALEVGVGRIVADNYDEVDRLEHLAAGIKVSPRVLVRVNPDVTAETHKSIRTGHKNSKFGVAITDNSAEVLVRRIKNSKHLYFGGVHVHIGSQMIDLDPLTRAIRLCAEFAKMVSAEELIVGGGVGVSYQNRDVSPSITEWGNAARGATLDAGFGGRLLAEPGRVLIASAGVTLYTIGTIKLGANTNILAIDGGISDNPRPAMYQARYQPLLVRNPFISSDSGPFTLVGKNCESSDVFGSDVDIPGDPRLGDLICLPVTGAYSYSMASQYNGLGRPAVVMVNRGESRVVARRETIEDLLRLDEVA